MLRWLTTIFWISLLMHLMETSQKYLKPPENLVTPLHHGQAHQTQQKQFVTNFQSLIDTYLHDTGENLYAYDPEGTYTGYGDAPEQFIIESSIVEQLYPVQDDELSHAPAAEGEAAEGAAEDYEESLVKTAMIDAFDSLSDYLDSAVILTAFGQLGLIMGPDSTETRVDFYNAYVGVANDETDNERYNNMATVGAYLTYFGDELFNEPYWVTEQENKLCQV